MLESKLQRDIQVAVTNLGGYPVKIHGNQFQKAGTPDILACKNGQFYAFEVKVATPVTAKQVHELTRVYNAGGVALAVYSVAQVLELFAHPFEVQRQLSYDNLIHLQE